jgi:hypothetical protein
MPHPCNKAPDCLTDRQQTNASDKQQLIEGNAILESFSGLRKYGFLRHIVLILIFQSTIFTVIEFHFTKDVQSHISHSDEIHHNSAGNLHASLFEILKKIHEAKNFTRKKIKQFPRSHLLSLM